MTDEEKTFDFMLNVAWKGIEATQQGIDKIDNKANNIMAISGLLMTVNGGILAGLLDKIPPLIVLFLLLDLILLAIGIYYALRTIWLREQESLDIKKTFEALDLTNHLKAIGDLAVSIKAWQMRSKKIGDEKGTFLLKSMYCFMGALIFIIVIAIASIILNFC